MAKTSHITVEYVRSILDYDPETGIFTWKKKPRNQFKSDRDFNFWNSKYAGSVAGGKNSKGYIQIKIEKVIYKAHRIAILFTTGTIPNNDVDHIDGDKCNNKIKNLRIANRSQNVANTKVRINSTSGLKCVCWNIGNKKYQARIRVDGASVHLGYFDCPAAASFAYQIAADIHFGEFARPF